MSKEIPLQKCKIITYCKFCKAEGKRVRCTFRTRYKPRYKDRDWYKHYSCDEHKGLIEDPDPDGSVEYFSKNPVKEKDSRDDHYTEADYQTWMRV